LEPIIVGKYNNSVLKTRHIIKGTKFWSEIQNKTGYQLIDGAHRLSIALFLQHKEIPVKVIRPLTFEIPNYTKEFLDSPLDSPWGTTQREMRSHREFSLKQFEEINNYCSKKKLIGMYHVGTSIVKYP